MKVYHHKDCQEFIAGDATHLREILHPDKMDIAALQFGACRGKTWRNILSTRADNE